MTDAHTSPDIVARMKHYIYGENDDYIPEVLQLACAEIDQLRRDLSHAKAMQEVWMNRAQAASRKQYADDWMRQIINAGGDENVAQQAVALAALNGLFDHVHDPAQPVTRPKREAP